MTPLHSMLQPCSGERRQSGPPGDRAPAIADIAVDADTLLPPCRAVREILPAACEPLARLDEPPSYDRDDFCREPAVRLDEPSIPSSARCAGGCPLNSGIARAGPAGPGDGRTCTSPMPWRPWMPRDSRSRAKIPLDGLFQPGGTRSGRRRGPDGSRKGGPSAGRSSAEMRPAVVRLPLIPCCCCSLPGQS